MTTPCHICGGPPGKPFCSACPPEPSCGPCKHRGVVLILPHMLKALFVCKHPSAPKDHVLPLMLFSGPAPSWCPLREVP